MKCKVIHSHCINSKPYDIWVVVQKNESNESSGYIHSAYRTCTAGILGIYNHVIGLFRFENPVQTGQTKASKTSVLCTWNIPKGQRVDTNLKPVWGLVFETSVYTKPKPKSVKLVNVWKYNNTRNTISFSVSKISFIFLMTPTDSTND